jgi:hypothetical protein
MKKLLTYTLVVILFFLASCKSLLTTDPPITKTVVDTIQEPVEVSLPEKTEVVVPALTKVETVKETPALTAKQEEIILPPKTEIVLKDETPVEIIKTESVVLPVGTKVETQKTNWYAVLLYAGLIISGIWIFLKREK